MTHLALLMVGLLTAADRAAPADGSPCTGKEDLLAIKGKWTARSDVGRGPGIPANVAPEVSTRIDRIGQLFRAAYPEPRGMDAAGYRDLDAPQFLENGPYAYSYRSMYLAWSCNTRTHKLQLGGETATRAYAFVNHPDLVRRAAEDAPHRGPADLFADEAGRKPPGSPQYEGIHNQSSNMGQTFPGDSRDPPGVIAAQARDLKQFSKGYLAALDAQLAPMIADIREVVAGLWPGSHAHPASGGIR
jgi:hypothetical protein